MAELPVNKLAEKYSHLNGPVIQELQLIANWRDRITKAIVDSDNGLNKAQREGLKKILTETYRIRAAANIIILEISDKTEEKNWLRTKSTTTNTEKLTINPAPEGEQVHPTYQTSRKQELRPRKGEAQSIELKTRRNLPQTKSITRNEIARTTLPEERRNQIPDANLHQHKNVEVLTILNKNLQQLLKEFRDRMLASVGSLGINPRIIIGSH